MSDVFTGVNHAFMQTVVTEMRHIILGERVYLGTESSSRSIASDETWGSTKPSKYSWGGGKIQNIFVLVVLQACVLLAKLNNF